MSSSQQNSANNPNPTSGKPFQERRRRRRAKISAQVHIKMSAGTPFEEVCMSVDVSRDGLLFVTSRKNYQKGQRVQITFPYSAAAAAISTAQYADVVRTIEMPDGRIGVGVEFKDSSTTSKKDEPATAKSPVSKSVVLAVEPDARQADMLRNLLSQDGYTVMVVPTAKQALDVLRTTTPAVFLAEVEAQDMSGHDLCLIIKRNERLQQVPVILLTRSAQPADYSASHSLGAVICMAKPFKPERLQHVIRLVAPPPRMTGSMYAAPRMATTVERSL